MKLEQNCMAIIELHFPLHNYKNVMSENAISGSPNNHVYIFYRSTNYKYHASGKCRENK